MSELRYRLLNYKDICTNVKLEQYISYLHGFWYIKHFYHVDQPKVCLLLKKQECVSHEKWKQPLIMFVSHSFNISLLFFIGMTYHK